MVGAIFRLPVYKSSLIKELSIKILKYSIFKAKISWFFSFLNKYIPVVYVYRNMPKVLW